MQKKIRKGSRKYTPFSLALGVVLQRRASSINESFSIFSMVLDDDALEKYGCLNPSPGRSQHVCVSSSVRRF
jgi:hypothetical protein